MKRAFLLLVLLLAQVAIAKAQPTCNSSAPGSPQCQSQAVAPQLTDILLGAQATGPTRSNQTVKFSISQILNLPGSTWYMPLSGGTFTGEIKTPAATTGTAGLNLGQGTAPTAPVNGDIWITSSGVYIQAGGSTVGPLGSGGGGSGTVNSSTQYAIGYYAANGSAISGLTAAANAVLGTNGSSVPSLSSTLPSGLTIPAPTTTGKLTTAASATGGAGFNLPAGAAPTSPANGDIWTTTGGVFARVNGTTQTLAPTTSTMTIGGQSIALGGSTTNAGNGAALQLSTTATKTSGHCVQFDANGNTVDAGGACTTGGGGGTVTAGTVNQLTWYSASGTTVAGLATANNGVLVTSGTGVPSISTTLPASLTMATPSISSPAISGTGTYVNLTGSGKLTTTASATGAAGLNVPAGTAPTSPTNGDVWTTTTGLFVRVNGATQQMGTGSGTITSVATNSPLSGGTVSSGPVTVSCSTCLTVTGGGALTATSPLSLSGSTLSLGNQTVAYSYWADAFTVVGNSTYYIYGKFPYTTGSVTSVSYLTGGTGTPSFSIAVQVNGSNVTTCNGITVNSGTIATTNCGSNSISSGQPVTLIISGSSGNPSNALVQVNIARSAV